MTPCPVNWLLAPIVNVQYIGCEIFCHSYDFTCSMENINLIQSTQPEWATEIEVRRKMGLDPFRGKISLFVDNFYCYWLHILLGACFTSGGKN